MNKNYWQVRKGSQVFAHGPESTCPSAPERRNIRSGGYSIYINGKIYRQ